MPLKALLTTLGVDQFLKITYETQLGGPPINSPALYFVTFLAIHTAGLVGLSCTTFRLASGPLQWLFPSPPGIAFQALP